MLSLALTECVKLNIKKALITCDKSNVASAKTIINNGGKLENEIAEGNRITQRYWITTDMIDIGAYSLNVNCYGKGTPTVIFESGLGDDSGVWTLVQPEISKNTRTFSYDRAGLGNSDTGDLPRTSLDQVHELHTVLNKAKVKGQSSLYYSCTFNCRL